MGYTTKEIIELMEKASALHVSIVIADKDFTIKIDSKEEHFQAAPAALPAMPAPVAAAPAAPVPAVAEPCGTIIKSPIVGTYYNAPAPDKEKFIEVGKAVKKGDVLFIIESMKLMNEVQSDCDGVVKEIIASNGQAVEYGQPILVLE